jgi:phosphoglucomutase
LGESKTPGALRNISVVYTPLNGAGSIPVRKILTQAGIKKITVVPEQENPDPEFTTCPEPNPEKIAALRLGLDLCEKLKAEGDAPDLLIGTDPDADRLGAAVLHQGAYARLSGNQVGFLIFDYILLCRARDGASGGRAQSRRADANAWHDEARGGVAQGGKSPDRPVFVTTIVSTPLTGEMARKHGVETRKVLTGFKNIGDQMNSLERDGEEGRYLFGFEESCGYLSGIYARDKDAQNAALLLLEAAGLQKARGKTLIDRTEELYREYGYFIDGLDEFVRPGEKGMHEILAIMEKLRDPATLNAFGAAVSTAADYREGIAGIPPSDVVEFDLADGCKILARPSGTEPKLKIYYTGVGPTEDAAKKAIERMRIEVAALTL